MVERVRGQVSDLDLTLVQVEAKPSTDVARALALVWFTRPDPNRDRIVVHATHGEQHRAWVREIGDGAPAVAGELSSATLEAAALVVREALRDLLRNDPPEPEPRAEPKRAVAAPIRAPPVTKPKSRPARVGIRAELGWEIALDGVGLFRRQGPALLLGATYRALELSLFAGSSLPVTERDRYGAIRLLRQVAGVRAGNEWRVSDAFALNLGLRAGLALYARSAEELRPVVVPRGDRVSASLLFGPELRAAWAPASGPFELTLACGLDAVPGAPRIGYQVDGHFEPSFSVWPLQPTLGIKAAFRTDRGR